MMLRGTTSVTSMSVFLSWFSFRLILNMYSLTASDPGFRPRQTMYLQMVTSWNRLTDATIFCKDSLLLVFFPVLLCFLFCLWNYWKVKNSFTCQDNFLKCMFCNSYLDHKRLKHTTTSCSKSLTSCFLPTEEHISSCPLTTRHESMLKGLLTHIINIPCIYKLKKLQKSIMDHLNFSYLSLKASLVDICPGALTLRKGYWGRVGAAIERDIRWRIITISRQYLKLKKSENMTLPLAKRFRMTQYTHCMEQGRDLDVSV